MFIIDLPTFTVAETYPICVGFVSSKPIRAYLKSLEIDINEYGRDYDFHARNKQLEKLGKRKCFELKENKSNEWLIKLYKYYFSQTTKLQYSAAHTYYSKIKVYGEDGTVMRCCYCNSNKIDVIDHFLPESTYLGLTVNPFNLVPSCDHCNDEKHAYEPILKIPSTVLIHPYYDDIRDLEWLKLNFEVKVISGHKFIKSNVFVNEDLKHDDIVLFNRIKLTFEKVDLKNNLEFKVNDFFNTELLPDFKNGELREMNNVDLKILFRNKGGNLNTNGYGLNHWKVAMYKALADYQGDYSDFF